MKSIAVLITYDIVSEESARAGDVADHGFADENENTYSIADAEFTALEGKIGRSAAIDAMAQAAGIVEFDHLYECVDWLANRGPLEPSDSNVRVERTWLTQLDLAELDAPRFSYHLKGDLRAKRAVLRAYGYKAQ